MMLNVTNPPPVTAKGGDLSATEELTYLWDTVRYNGWAGRDIKNCFGKVRNAHRMLNNG